jgi:hypothetical protein
MSALKTCVLITAELISGIGKVLEDKKVNFSEIVGLAPQIIKIPKFVANIQPALDELKAGVSPIVLQEIQVAVAAKLDLQNDKSEQIVELCINWIVLTSSTAFEIIKTLKSK